MGSLSNPVKVIGSQWKNAGLWSKYSMFCLLWLIENRIGSCRKDEQVALRLKKNQFIASIILEKIRYSY